MLAGGPPCNGFIAVEVGAGVVTAGVDVEVLGGFDVGGDEVVFAAGPAQPAAQASKSPSDKTKNARLFFISCLIFKDCNLITAD